MSTSWTCDDSDNWNGDCKLIYDLFWYRHIKEVKIGKLCRSYVSIVLNFYRRKPAGIIRRRMMALLVPFNSPCFELKTEIMG